MVVAKKDKELDLWSETGKKVLDLKKVLLVNAGNDLIFEGLLSSIKESDYPSHVFQALGDLNCNATQFEKILMTFKQYRNAKVIEQHLNDMRIKLSTRLERTGLKHFTTETNVDKGSVSVIKKIGINEQFIQKEFRLTPKESAKLIKDGFAEKFAELLLKAITKNLINDIEKAHGKDKAISLSISKFYKDNQSGYFNMDFIIDVTLSHVEKRDALRVTNYVSIWIKKVLETVDTTYYKYTNK